MKNWRGRTGEAQCIQLKIVAQESEFLPLLPNNLGSIPEKQIIYPARDFPLSFQRLEQICFKICNDGFDNFLLCHNYPAICAVDPPLPLSL
jgi:hypothetical protein